MLISLVYLEEWDHNHQSSPDCSINSLDKMDGMIGKCVLENCVSLFL